MHEFVIEWDNIDKDITKYFCALLKNNWFENDVTAEQLGQVSFERMSGHRPSSIFISITVSKSCWLSICE